MKNLAQDYFEAGYYLTPVVFKRPYLENWQTFQEFNEANFQHAKGLGLLTGRNVVVIDIDYEDGPTKEIIKPILDRFYTRIQRQGNKNRLPSLFYKTDKEIETIKFGKVEVLGLGRQCVIPPSPHPLGYNYKWVNESLLEAGEYLPEFDYNLIYELQAIIPNNYEMAKAGGRNDHLKKVVTAKIFEAKDPTTIINELIEYDKRHHPDNPLFEDKSEGARSGIPFYEASRFYFNNMKTQVNRGQFVVPFNIQIIENDPPIIKEQERIKFPKLRGIAQEMFEYQYKNNPVPRSRLISQSVISCISATVGNRLKIGKIHPNLYCLGVLESGAGKDASHIDFPSTLFQNYSNLLNVGMPGSDTGVIKPLETHNTRIDIIDEMSAFFGVADNYDKNPYMTKAADIYTQLYSSPGRHFSGKALAGGQTGKCFSPYITLLGATTPKGFKQTVTENILEKGFLGRFLIVFDDKPKFATIDLEKFKDEFPTDFLDFVKYWRDLRIDDNIIQNAKDINLGHKVNDRVKEISVAIQELKKEKSIVSDINISPIFDRAAVNVVKVAMIDAVSIAWSEKKPWPTLTIDNIEWAYSYMTNLLKATNRFLNENIKHDYIARNEVANTILYFLRKTPEGMDKTKLSKKLCKKGILAQQRDENIRTLIEAGLIAEKKQDGKFIFIPLEGGEEEN